MSRRLPQSTRSHITATRVVAPRHLVAAIASAAVAMGTLVNPFGTVQALAAAPAPIAPAAPPTYTGTATSSLATVRADVLNGIGLAAVSLGSSTSTTHRTGTPRSSASVTSAGVGALGLNLPVGTNEQTAPGDNPSPRTQELAGLDLLGIAKLGTLGTSTHARWLGDGLCAPAATPLARTETTTTGLDVALAGASVIDTGALRTSTSTGLSGTGTHRAVTSTSSSGETTVALLNGQVSVTLSAATLTGTNSGSGTTTQYTAPRATVRVGGGAAVDLVPGAAARTVNVGLGKVSLALNDLRGKTFGDVLDISVDVLPLPLVGPTASVDVGLFPLSVAAGAPAGGVDCTLPAPAIASPATGSVTADSTPTVTGSGVPGATTTLRAQGESAAVGTATVGSDGTWSIDSSPRRDGTTTFTATQSFDGNTSPASGAITFDVDTTAPPAPVIEAPVGPHVGTGLTLSGTAERGSTVVVTDGRTPATTWGPVQVRADGTWDVPVANLPEGGTTFTATATDDAGNTSPASAPVSTTVDTTSPATPAVTSVTDGDLLPTGPATLAGTTEAGTTVLVSVDGGAPQPAVVGGGRWTLDLGGPLGEGAHSVTAIAHDAAGNLSATSQPVRFSVDSVAPVAPVVLTPIDGSTVRDAAVTVTGLGEPGATVIVTGLRETTNPVLVDRDGSWSVTGTLVAGANALTVTQHDDTQNTSAETRVTVTLDTAVVTTPVAQPVVAAPNDSPDTDGSVDFAGTGEPTATIDLYSGTRPIVTGITVGPDGSWTAAPVTLGDGAHVVTARQGTGTAPGTSVLTSAPVVVTVDATAPAAPGIQTPADGSALFTSTTVVSGTAEPGATVTVTVNGDDFQTTAGGDGSWSLLVHDLPEGAVALTATATDAAGHTSDPAQTQVAVDTTAPEAPTIDSPPADRPVHGPVVVSGTAEAGDLLVLDEDGREIYRGTVPAGPWKINDLVEFSDGPHVLQAVTVDGAGRTSRTTVRTFTLDTTAPAAPVVTSPQGTATLTTGTPVITGLAEPAATVTVTGPGGFEQTTTADGTGRWTIGATSTDLPDGQVSELQVTQTDLAGNTSPAAPVRVKADRTAEVPTLTGVPTGLTRDTTPQVGGTAEPGATVTVLVNGTPATTATAGVDGAWSADLGPLADGEHRVSAQQVDELGNRSPTSAAVVLTVDTVALAPMISSPRPLDIVPGDTTVSGTGESGATVTVREGDTVLGRARVRDDGTWSVTPTAPLPAGLHVLSATQVDAAGNTSPPSASLPFTVTTTATPPAADAPAAPVITSPTGGQVQRPVVVSGTAPAGTTVVLYDGASPVATTTATTGGDGGWTLRPDLLPGPHVLTARAIDAEGRTSPLSGAVVVTVTDPAPPVPLAAPIITAPGDGSTVTTTPRIAGTGVEGSVLTLFVDGAPAGTTTVTGGTWDLTAALTPGRHVLSARHSDAGGAVSALSNAVTVTVEATPGTPRGPAAPTITTPAQGADVETDFTVTGTGTPGGEVVLSVDGEPQPTVTVAANGTWSVKVTGTRGLVLLSATQSAGGVTSPAVVLAVLAPLEGASTASPAITSPRSGATGTAVREVSGTGIDGASVQVFIDGIPAGSAVVRDGAWTVELPEALDSGAHVITATQTVGDTTSQPSREVVLVVTSTTTPSTTPSPDPSTTPSPNPSTTAPTTDPTTTPTTPPAAPTAPRVSSPVDGSTVQQPALVRGTGLPGAVVVVRESGVEVGRTTVAADGSWSVTPSPALTPGRHAVSVVQTGPAGVTSPATAVSFDVTPRGAAPVIRRPVRDSTVTAPLVVAGTGVEGATVTVLVDGRPAATATVTGGRWVATLTGLTAGTTPTLTATQQPPGAGASTTSNAVPVTVRTPLAQSAVTISTPLDGTRTRDGRPVVGGTGRPGTTVTLRDGSRVVATATVMANGHWLTTPDPALASGSHALIASQPGLSGGTETSGTTTIVIDPTAWTAPTFDTPTDGAVSPLYRPVLGGAGEPGATLTVRTSDGVVLGSTLVRPDGRWQLTPGTDLEVGDNLLTAVQTMGALRAEAPPMVVTIDPQAPITPQITTPADLLVSDDEEILVAGTGHPGGEIVVLHGRGDVIGSTTVAADGTWTLGMVAHLEGVQSLIAMQSVPYELVQRQQLQSASRPSADGGIRLLSTGSGVQLLADAVEVPAYRSMSQLVRVINPAGEATGTPSTPGAPGTETPSTPGTGTGTGTPSTGTPGTPGGGTTGTPGTGTTGTSVSGAVSASTSPPATGARTSTGSSARSAAPASTSTVKRLAHTGADLRALYLGMALLLLGAVLILLARQRVLPARAAAVTSLQVLPRRHTNAAPHTARGSRSTPTPANAPRPRGPGAAQRFAAPIGDTRFARALRRCAGSRTPSTRADGKGPVTHRGPHDGPATTPPTRAHPPGEPREAVPADP